MKKYKIILELLLAIVLMVAGYYIYKIAMNMRHDIPIITGQVSDTDLSHIKNGLSGSSTENINTSGMNSVATFTESLNTLETEMSYPKERSDLLGYFMLDYNKWKLELKEQIDATTTYNGGKLSYQVLYRSQSTSTPSGIYGSDGIKSYVFDTYQYSGGAHGSTGAIAYNFNNNNNNNKIKSIYDLYLNLFKIYESNNSNESNASIKPLQLKTKDALYKKIHDTIKLDLSAQLKENNGAEKVDIRWLDEGIAYNATGTDNYKLWWLDGDNLVIYISQYQIAPYVYGDFETRVPLGAMMR